MSSSFDFSPLSQQWLDKDGAMKMLHRMNPARIHFVQRYIDKGMSGLDIGAGAGIFTIDFSSQGFRCDALEKRQELVATGKEQCKKLGLDITWHQDDVLDFQAQQMYDYVTCFEVIEHIEDREVFLNKLLSLVKPGGYLFFSTLNRTFLSYVTAVLGAEYLLKILPVGTHDYKLFMKPDEISDLLEGASLIDLQGLIYNPLTKKFFLGQSLQTNYIGVWKKD